MVVDPTEEGSVAPPDPSQFTGTIPDAICSMGVQPQVLTGYFVNHLHHHFCSPQTIEEPDLRTLIWQMTPNTAILVKSIFEWDPATTGTRPAILVKRNSYRRVQIGIGDRKMGVIGDLQGNSNYEAFWAGSHTLFCLSENAAQADLLGTEVARQLGQMGPIINSVLDLQKWQVQELGAPVEIEEATENVVVPVSVNVAYREAWKLRPIAPVFTGINLRTLLGCPLDPDFRAELS